MITVIEYPIEGARARELTQKFNEVFADNVGYVPRSPDLWLEIYRCDSEAHLLIAEEEKEMCGYVIVTLQHYYGCRVAAISEICVWEKQLDVFEALLDQAEFYAEKMNAYAVVSWGTSNEKMSEVFRRQGFIFLGKSVFSVGLVSLDFLKLVLESREGLSTTKYSKCEREITVDLGRKKFISYSGIFTIKINSNGKVSINEGKSSAPYACIKTDIITFTEIILGIRNPYNAVLLGAVRIMPLWKATTIIGLLKSLSKRLNWHIPLGDFF